MDTYQPIFDAVRAALVGLEQEMRTWGTIDDGGLYIAVTQVDRWADRLAAILASHAAPGWQPIATAPTDGAAFLAYGESLIGFDFNPIGIVEARFDRGRIISADWNRGYGLWNTVPIEPTHWMPLPLTPGNGR